MKKRIVVTLLAVIMCLMLASCGGISKDKAVEIALANIGTTKVYVQKWEVEFDKAKNVYEVTAWKEGKHVIVVDAKSGNIISSEVTPEE